MALTTEKHDKQVRSLSILYSALYKLLVKFVPHSKHDLFPPIQLFPKKCQSESQNEELNKTWFHRKKPEELLGWGWERQEKT